MGRADRAVELCRRLSADVTGIAPRGVGLWSHGWEIVSGPSARFIDILDQWEQGEAHVADVSMAYDEVLEAWTEAARQYQELGRATGSVRA